MPERLNTQFEIPVMSNQHVNQRGTFLDAVLRWHRLRPVSHIQVTVDHRDEPGRHHGVGIVGIIVADVDLRRRSSCDRLVLDLVSVNRAGRRDEGFDAEGPRPGMIARSRLLCCYLL